MAVLGRVVATVVAVVPAVMAVAAWVQAVLRTSAEGALGALAVTGAAAVYGLAVW